jgi:lantibiotic modifying enzyme
MRKPGSSNPPAAAHSLTRREALGLGVGAVASMLGLPGLARPEPRAASTPTLASTLARLGASAATPPATRSRPELELALRAARWIRSARVETPRGITWPADPSKPTTPDAPASIETDLYNGMPGVVLFHLELYHATGDRAWLWEARAGANELAAQLPRIHTSGDWGLYTGMAGAAFVLEETHRASGEGRYRDAAMQAVQLIHAAARKTGAGVAWPAESATTDIISGSAGLGLLLLWADQQMRDPSSRALAIAAGRQLLEQGQPANGGTRWAIAPDVRNLYPNFSHGTAGVSYFLATLYRLTGDHTFLDGALSGATYLQAVANTDGDGFKVFHHEPGGEDLFYLSWCHGPAGTSRLFYRLSEVTSDEHWLEMIRRAARATIDSGIPERRTPGFWNNISQCCGNSGVGEYFLSLQQIMPDPAYAEMVRRIAADTLHRATAAGDGLEWIQAENRVQPDIVVAQTGYMQGASGVGTLFLHMDAAAQQRPRPIAWPDSPFA